MAFEALNQFNLVGGTALALQFWHRISVDLDFFTEEAFDVTRLKNEFIQTFSEEHIIWQLEKERTLLLKLDGIKIDIIHYPYPLIDNLIIEENIRMLSPKDIAPMKLGAIAKRGAKKDFFDFYELSQRYSLEEMLQFYQEKFPHTDTSFLLRALVYFDDAEKHDDPIMIKPYTRNQVKKNIVQQVNQFFER